eukprot:TRINITY_DN4732_c0_g1_i1.p1 TRINITY_DN4732_c0_g1~~TRINITY_DN4732_c0_g1_i1.p1  ORF type:complete len:100 (+),score=3.37 TRINITY_DN4732_c0_g1_i1:63-362(+)
MGFSSIEMIPRNTQRADGQKEASNRSHRLNLPNQLYPYNQPRQEYHQRHQSRRPPRQGDYSDCTNTRVRCLQPSAPSGSSNTPAGSLLLGKSMYPGLQR